MFTNKNKKNKDKAGGTMSHLENIRVAIAAHFDTTAEKVEIGYPPKIDFGDIAIPCFSFAKNLSQSPVEVAKKLAEFLNQEHSVAGLIVSAQALGPYVNLKLSDRLLCSETARSVETSLWLELLLDLKAMVEFLSPNTNKPLHLGHLRNAFLGDAVSRILAASGQKVVKANLINDRGVHICKSMLAWQRWANGETPESTDMKGDHFVGKWYVRFEQELQKEREQWYAAKGLDRKTLNDEDKEKLDNEFLAQAKLMQEAQELLKKWEAKDPEIIELWQKMNKWVLDGFQITLDRLGIGFDRVYFESETYLLGKDIVEQGLKKGVFILSPKGVVVYPLPQETFGTELDGSQKYSSLLRPDGTSVYITQDIGTAVMKVEEFGLNRSIYVVGSEQDYHFQCLFSILKALGYSWADNCYHLSYGMVNLPEGKMKSREGTVVDADDLIDDMIQRAKDLISTKQTDLPPDEVEKRAVVIALGAMKFYFLLSPPRNSMNYDPAASISFDGTTGPYCQYAVARCNSLLEKAQSQSWDLADLPEIEAGTELGLAERQLAQKILQLPERIQNSANNLDPSVLARHIFDIARCFSQFYNSTPVLADTSNQSLAAARLTLVMTTRTAIKEGLALLGIETLEKM